MSHRPAYYTEIDKRFENLENRQREFRDTVDDILVGQADQMKRMDQIHFLLAGTDYENKNNGGLVGEVKRVKCKVDKNTLWRIRITAIVSFAGGAIGFILFKFSAVISSIKNLINIE